MKTRGHDCMEVKEKRRRRENFHPIAGDPERLRALHLSASRHMQKNTNAFNTHECINVCFSRSVLSMRARTIVTDV